MEKVCQTSQPAGRAGALAGGASQSWWRPVSSKIPVPNLAGSPLDMELEKALDGADIAALKTLARQLFYINSISASLCRISSYRRRLGRLVINDWHCKQTRRRELADLTVADIENREMQDAARMFGDLLTKLGNPDLRLEPSQDGSRLRLWVVHPSRPDLVTRLAIADQFGRVLDTYPDLLYDYRIISEAELAHRKQGQG